MPHGGSKKEGAVYLIHFERPYHHARHYLGWTDNIAKRMREHANGQGSPLMRAVTLARIPWRVVYTEEGSRDLEKRYKSQKNASRLCPLCR